MSEVADVIRSWMIKAPRPNGLHVYSKDGREHDVEMNRGTAWAECARTIAALDPERIEAYQDKQLIKATTLADLLKREEQVHSQEAATTRAMQSTDPETQRMIVFAELLEKAYCKAYESSQSTVQIAFTQLQEICGSLAQQATASQASASELSVAIRNLLIQQAQDVVDQANAGGGGQSPLEELAANFLNGKKMAEAEAAAKTNGAKPNGKH